MTVSDVKNRRAPAEAEEPVKRIHELKCDDGKKDNVEEQKKERWFDFKSPLVWANIFGFGVLHLLFFYHLLTFPYLKYKGLVLWALFMAEMNLLSITTGVHRLWSHRCYKAKAPLRIFLAVFYVATGMIRISHWVREHRIHHKYTDSNADPHNSKRGLFFSHIGWQLMKKHPDVITKGKTIDYTDMKNDKVVAFFDKYHGFLRIFLCFILPVFIPVYFFDQDLKAAIITQWFMRVPYVINIMFSINSFAHAIGYRSYNKTIKPTEHGLCSFLTTGEGWHNYHHTFPQDYKAAEWGSSILNRATFWIRLWEKMGLAYDLKEVSESSIKRCVERQGDGSHPVYKSLTDTYEAQEEPEEHPY